MYFIIGVFSTIGSVLPMLFGSSSAMWSIFGGFVGSIIGIVVYVHLRRNGYVE